jgi:ABC-type multidrug transport system ATPase subunit
MQPERAASISTMLQQTLIHPHTTHNNVLSVMGLCGGPGDLPLFRDLAMQLPAGVSALLGDEGVGKTSLLRLLSGDLVATAGQLRLASQASPLSLPQPSAVFWIDPRLPLHDNDTPVQCWAHIRTSLPAWSDATQNELIDVLQLAPHLDKRLNMLSTGSRRKVGLVAALASGAKVTLLDQPFVALDQASIRSLQAFLAQRGPNTERAWLIADYEKPAHLPLVSVLQL